MATLLNLVPSSYFLMLKFYKKKLLHLQFFH